MGRCKRRQRPERVWLQLWRLLLPQRCAGQCTAQQAGYVPEFLQAVEAVNQFQKLRLHGLISQQRAGRCQWVGFENRSLVLRAVPERPRSPSAWRSWGGRITRLGGGLLLARWCEGLGGAGALREGVGRKVHVRRRRLARKPVKTRRPCAAVQVYCDEIGMWRADQCQWAGLENRSLVLRAVPGRRRLGRAACGAARQ